MSPPGSRGPRARRRATGVLAVLVVLAAVTLATPPAGSPARVAGPAAVAARPLPTPAPNSDSGAGATADAVVDPASRFPVDGPAIQAARQIARMYWGRDACGGAVTLEWTTLEPQTNAQSVWRNAVSTFGAPDDNSDCQIQLNRVADFDWPKLCTVIVHEYGHLTGHPHSSDPTDVMYAFYDEPLPACAQTPEPGLTGDAASGRAQREVTLSLVTDGRTFSHRRRRHRRHRRSAASSAREARQRRARHAS